MPPCVHGRRAHVPSCAVFDRHACRSGFLLNAGTRIVYGLEGITSQSMGFGKNKTGAILRSNQTVALGTLVNNTAIKLTSPVTLQEDFRVLRADVVCHGTTVTQGEGTGLVLGACNGELSVAEIGETLLADGPADRNDRLVQERAERKVDLISSAIENEGSIIWLGD